MLILNSKFRDWRLPLLRHDLLFGQLRHRIVIAVHQAKRRTRKNSTSFFHKSCPLTLTWIKKADARRNHFLLVCTIIEVLLTFVNSLPWAFRKIRSNLCPPLWVATLELIPLLEWGLDVPGFGWCGRGEKQGFEYGCSLKYIASRNQTKGQGTFL